MHHVRAILFATIAITTVGGAGCDDNDKNYAADIAALRRQVAGLQTQLAAVTARLDAAQPTLAAAARLQTAVDVDDAGAVIVTSDLIVEGANLHIRNGMGRTEVANGTGNLIVGYNEPPGVCGGGPNSGLLCLRDSNCTDYDTTPPGTYSCQVFVAVREGSHSIILGEGHQYSGYTAFVGGVLSTVSGLGGVVLAGARNTVTGTNGVVVSGSGHVVAGYAGVALGGDENEVSYLSSVVLGGLRNSTSTSHDIVPRYVLQP